MKNRKGNLLMTLGLVLILAALALVGYNQWDASRAQQESDDALMALEQIRIQRQMESQQTAAPPVITATMMPTDTPATDAPITDAPTADATAADTPAASTPSVTDALTTDIPRDDVTATNTPATSVPATVNPATNQPNPTNAPTAGTDGAGVLEAVCTGGFCRAENGAFLGVHALGNAADAAAGQLPRPLALAVMGGMYALCRDG